MEKGDWITFNLNIIKILSRKLQHKMSYTQQGGVERLEEHQWCSCENAAQVLQQWVKFKPSCWSDSFAWWALWSEGLAMNCQDRWRWGGQHEEEEVSDQCCNFSVLSEHTNLWWNSRRGRAAELWRRAGQIQHEQSAVCQDRAENRRGNLAAPVMSWSPAKAGKETGSAIAELLLGASPVDLRKTLFLGWAHI